VPDRIADCLGQIGCGGDPTHLMLQPDVQRLHDRSTSRLAHLLAVFGGMAADLSLNRIELADLR
jgi:hypothetical protein